MKPLPYILLILLIAVFIGSILVLTGCTLTVSIKGKEKAETIKVENHIPDVGKMVGNVQPIFTPTPQHDPHGFIKESHRKSKYDLIKDAHNQEWDSLPQMPPEYHFRPKDGSMYQDSKGNWVTYHENAKKDSTK